MHINCGYGSGVYQNDTPLNYLFLLLWLVLFDSGKPPKYATVFYRTGQNSISLYAGLTNLTAHNACCRPPRLIKSRTVWPSIQGRPRQWYRQAAVFAAAEISRL